MEFEGDEEGGSWSELQLIFFVNCFSPHHFLTSACLLPLVCLSVLLCFLLIHCDSVSEETVARSPKVRKTSFPSSNTSEKGTLDRVNNL